MSYKLEKLFSESQRIEFIVNYNHNKGLKIEQGSDGSLFALEEDEIMQNGVPVKNPNYEAELAQKRKEEFEKRFFNTSLGWIKRSVNMKDGSTKDFLSDLLLQIKAGMDMGQAVEIISYSQPDFSNDLTEEYMLTLQQHKTATSGFIQECLARTVADFCGG